MKRITLLGCAVLGITFLTCGYASLSAAGFAQQSTAIEQTLINLEREWSNAWMKADTATIDRIESNDFVGVDAMGVVYTKAEDIASIKNGEWKVQSIQLDDMKVRVYGDTAVVTGRFTQKAQYKGADRSYTGRFTDTWVNRGGRWQCVASQSTRITK